MAYPNTLDNLTVPVAQDTDPLITPDHPTAHNEERDAINALQTKVGIDGSVDSSTIDYLLKNPNSIDPGHKHTPADIIGGGGSSSGGGGTKLAIDTTQHVIDNSTSYGETDLCETIPIPAGTLGDNNAIRFKIFASLVNFANIGSPNQVNIRLKYGAQTLVTATLAGSQLITNPCWIEGIIVADNDTGAQKAQILMVGQSTVQADCLIDTYGTGTVDSTLDQDLVLTIDNSVSAPNGITTEGIIVEVIDGVQGGTIIGVTAAENISDGQSIGVSNLDDGKVSRAAVGAWQQTTGVTLDSYKAFEISTDKILIVYTESGNLSCVVATIDKSDMENLFTFGAPELIDGVSSTTVYDAHKLDTDKFAVMHSTVATPTVIQLIGGTVSGDVITLGISVTLATALSAVDALSCTQLGTDKGAAVYTGTGGQARGIVYTFSGTIATIGTAATLTTYNANRIIAVKVATDKFCYVSLSSVQVCSVSGTTITAGTSNDYYTGSGPVLYDAFSPDTNSIAVLHAENPTLSLIIGTISGTTVSYGAVTTFNSLSSTEYSVYVKSPTLVYIYGINAGIGSIIGVGISGSASTDLGIISTNFGVTAGYRQFIDMGTYFILAFANSTIIQYFAQGMSTGFIGFAENSPTLGGSVQVLVKGADNNQSGVIAGANYSALEGGITIDPDGVILGLSATQVFI